jgi:hypothetical protein
MLCCCLQTAMSASNAVCRPLCQALLDCFHTQLPGVHLASSGGPWADLEMCSMLSGLQHVLKLLHVAWVTTLMHVAVNSRQR